MVYERPSTMACFKILHEIQAAPRPTYHNEKSSAKVIMPQTMVAPTRLPLNATKNPPQKAPGE